MKTKKLIMMFCFIAIGLFMIGKTSKAATKSTATTTTENGGTIAWEFYYDETAKQITKLRCTNPSGIAGEIVIPSTITVEGETYTVVSLNYNAFKDATAITKVTIPDTVLSMVEYSDYEGCFTGCTSLTEVDLGKIGNLNGACFEDCTSLTKITLENITKIGNDCFNNCTSLTEVNLGNVTSIGNGAFRGCKSLKSIVIPDSVTNIGTSAFAGCTSLESCVLSKNITTLDSTFYNCTSLKSIELPESLTSILSTASIDFIANGTFRNCKSLSEIIIPDSVTTLGKFSFAGCTSLKSLKISNNVTELADGVFQDCVSLTEVEIPSSVVSIQSDSGSYGAFEDCEALQKVTIPDSVTFIGKYAFRNCGKGKLGLLVNQGSYAETWASDNDVPYNYEDEENANDNAGSSEKEPDTGDENGTSGEEDNDNKNEAGTSQEPSSDKGKDNSEYPGSFEDAKTGESFVIISIVSIITVTGVVFLRKFKNLKDID